MEVTGQLCGISSLSHLYGFQGLNSGSQAYTANTLYAEPSWQPLLAFLIIEL